jgi:hypothetical protein
MPATPPTEPAIEAGAWGNAVAMVTLAVPVCPPLAAVIVAGADEAVFGAVNAPLALIAPALAVHVAPLTAAPLCVAVNVAAPHESTCAGAGATMSAGGVAGGGCDEADGVGVGAGAGVPGLCGALESHAATRRTSGRNASAEAHLKVFIRSEWTETPPESFTTYSGSPRTGDKKHREARHVARGHWADRIAIASHRVISVV